MSRLHRARRRARYAAFLGGVVTPPLQPTIALVITPAAQPEGNSGTTAYTGTATLVRNGSTAAIPYAWSVAGAGANPADAADFGGAFPGGSGTFAAGETVKTFTILIAGDQTVELDETFLMTFVATGVGTAMANGTILNDDVAAPIVFANLTQVSNNLLATNAAQTWWSTQQVISPVGNYAVQGFTDNTGRQYLAELTASTRSVFDTRRIEEPNFFTADEHNSVAVEYTPNGALWVAVAGHSNAVSATIANQGRVLVLYSATGRIADLQQAMVYTLPSTTTTQGANYLKWRVRPGSNNELLLWTNNDAQISWKALRFTDGNYQNGQWLRAVAKNKPPGTSGENQIYMMTGVTGADTERLYFAAHASNVRNIVKFLDFEWSTGNIYTGGTTTTTGTVSLGSMYAGTATMYDFTLDSGAVTAFDPGAGSSVRMMYADGFDFGGGTYVNADGSNPRHVHISGGVAYDLGSMGPAFDLSRFYYRGITKAKEALPGSVAHRWFRCTTDGAGNDLCEKVDAPSLGGALTRTTILASSTQKILRPYAFDRANSNLALAIGIGAYTSYTSFTMGMVLSDGTPAVVAPSISYASSSVTIGEAGGAVSSAITAVRNGVTGDLVVNLTRGGTATSGSDYTPGPASVTIPAGQNSVTFTSATIIDDATPESSETIIETATLAAYPSVSATKTITITDNDTAGGTLFYDETFTETATINASGRTSDSGATYSALTGSLSVGGGSGRTHSANSPYEYLISTVMPSIDNFDIEVTIARGDNTANSIAFLFNADAAATPTALGLNLNNSAGTAAFIQYNGASASTSLASVAHAFVAGEVYTLRGRVSGGVKTLELLLGSTQIIAPVTVTGGPTGNRMHLRGTGANTTATTGLGYDRCRALSF